MKENQKILCQKCCGEIMTADDLVVVSLDQFAEPYHIDCYKGKVKSFGVVKRLFHLGAPINGLYGYVNLVVSLIYNAILLMIFGVKYWIPLTIVTLFVIWIRAYTWFKYERNLKLSPKDTTSKNPTAVGKVMIKSILDSCVAVFKFYVIIVLSGLLGKLLADLTSIIL